MADFTFPESDDEFEEPDVSSPTVLNSLRSQRKKIRDELTLDLAVPEYVNAYVRFRPVEPEFVRRAWRKREKAGDKGPLLAHADVLVEACVGVFMLDENGNEVSAAEDGNPEWPRFDARLAEAMGEPDIDSAVQVAIEFYPKKYHVLSTATKVLEWSGMSQEDIEERYRGN